MSVRTYAVAEPGSRDTLLDDRTQQHACSTALLNHTLPVVYGGGGLLSGLMSNRRSRMVPSRSGRSPRSKKQLPYSHRMRRDFLQGGARVEQSGRGRGAHCQCAAKKLHHLANVDTAGLRVSRRANAAVTTHLMGALEKRYGSREMAL